MNTSDSISCFASGVRQKTPDCRTLVSLTICLLGALTPIVYAQAGAAPGPDANLAAQQTAQRVLDQLAQDGDIDAARSGFKKVITAAPTYAKPRYNLAILAETEDRWDEAIRWLEEFVKLDSTSPLSKKASAELDRLKTIRDADATPAGKLHREYNQALVESRTLLNLGRLSEAVTRAEDAVALDDTRYEAFALVAMALSRRSYFDDAAVHLQKAIDRAPDTAQNELRLALNTALWESSYNTLVSTGCQAFQDKDYDGAAKQLTTVWRYFPERGETGLQAATALIMYGSYSSAATILDQISKSSDPKIAARASSMSTDLQTMRRDGDAAAQLNASARKTRTTATQQLATATAEVTRLTAAYNKSIDDSEAARENYDNAADTYNSSSGQSGDNPVAVLLAGMSKIRLTKYQQIYEASKSDISTYKNQLDKARADADTAQYQLDSLGNNGAVDVVWDVPYEVAIQTRPSLLPDAFLPSGTKLSLTVGEVVTSAKAKVGQQVNVSVTKDVLSPDGQIVIVHGGLVKGHIALAKDADPKKPSYLYVFDSVSAADNGTVTLSGSIAQKYPPGVSAKKPDSFLQQGAIVEASVATSLKVKKPDAPKVNLPALSKPTAMP